MPKSSTKMKPQPNVLLEATVRRMLAKRPKPKGRVKKKVSKKAR
jgi:hypothetical protein